MELVETLILGAVQGLTEFIPVSSSGHLVLTRTLFGINNDQGLAFDAVLHLATSLAILFYFRSDIKNLAKTFASSYLPIRANWKIAGWLWRKRRDGKNRRKTEIDEGNETNKKNDDGENLILLKALIFGSMPVVVFAFLFEKFITAELRTPPVVALALVAGSIIFWLAEQTGEKNRKLTSGRGFWTGFAQIFALIPGISRSGITIAGGLFAGLNRETATRFSFLLAFPIVFGSGAKKLLDLGLAGLLGELGFSIIVGSLTAFVFSYLSIKYMLMYLKNHSLTIFVFYRIILAAVIFIAVL